MAAGRNSNGSHTLQTPFIFSYMRRGKAVRGEPGAAASGNPATTAASSTASSNVVAAVEDSSHPYENAIKTISQVETVEGFWETYDFLKRPNDLPATTDYHFFRGGVTPIKPTWEDVRLLERNRKLVRSLSLLM